jgi:hypothetical protein
MFNTPRKFVESLEAAFSGSRFMRICMPPLMLFGALLFLVGGICGLALGRNLLMSSAAVSWGVAFVLAAYATWRPQRTRRLRGLLAFFLGLWFAGGAVAAFCNLPKPDMGILGVVATGVAVGAFFYGVGCFRGR